MQNKISGKWYIRVEHTLKYPRTGDQNAHERYESLHSNCSFFDRHDFRKLVDKYGNDKHGKGFSSWEHFVSMLFCQLGKAQSL
ncbi:MAG: DUF4372 domain-containing protein, partial [candidate division KSB1 bacterium]|nr:DUF4372 domain-containing protein [candidate division KSB1 bacterium]